MSILTVAFLWSIVHNKKSKVLVPETNEDLKRTLGALERGLRESDKKASGYIQKIGFLKFNPFQETGGSQSFSLALLNGEGDGFVLTSLHSRTGTRTYAKLINKGKSTTAELSKEEEEAVALAEKEQRNEKN